MSKKLLKKIPLIYFLYHILVHFKMDLNIRTVGAISQWVVHLLPDLFFFNFLRIIALKVSGTKLELGSGVIIRRNVFVEYPYLLELAEGVQINTGTYIGSNKKIKIGKKTRIGMNVQLITTSHDGVNFEIDSSKPIEIGEYCHIGAGAILLPGTKLEDRVQIAPGSVVSGHCKHGGIYVGNPARFIGLKE